MEPTPSFTPTPVVDPTFTPSPTTAVFTPTPGVGEGLPYQLPMVGNGYFAESIGIQEHLPKVATQAIDLLLLVVGAFAVIYLILGGITYITAGGNAERAKTARAMIINVVIGIVVIVAAFFIIRFAVGIGTTVSGLDANF